MSVLKRSLKLDTTESLSCEPRSTCKIQEMPLACTSINNESLSASLGNKKRDQRVQLHPLQPDGTSLHQLANETHMVSPDCA